VWIHGLGGAVCNSGTVHLQASTITKNFTISSYAWYIVSANGYQKFDSTALDTITVPLNTFPGNCYIQVRAYSGSCFISGYYYLQINPTVSIDAYKDSICNGEKLELIASGADLNVLNVNYPGVYTWTPAEGLYTGYSGPLILRVQIITLYLPGPLPIQPIR